MNQSALKIAVIQEARICLLASAAIKDSADPADALMVLARQVSEAQSRDDEMLGAISADAASRLQSIKWGIRGAYLLIALLPGIAFVISLGKEDPNWFYGFLVLFAVLLGLCVAMDRPGAWLSNLIKSYLIRSIDQRLRGLGRYDLAEHVIWNWVADELTWERAGAN